MRSIHLPQNTPSPFNRAVDGFPGDAGIDAWKQRKITLVTILDGALYGNDVDVGDQKV